MSDDDYMLHVMGNLPKEYEAVLIDLENRLMAESSKKLTIELMHQKLNAHSKDCNIKRRSQGRRESLGCN